MEKQRSKVRTTNPGEGVQLVMGKSGLEAAEPMTVGKMFQETVARFPEHPALRHKEGEDWQTLTYREYYSSSLRAAKSFLKLGLEPLHAVAIIGFNSKEWHISNLGAMFAGGLAAGIYTTSSPEACHFVADHCKANVIVVENDSQLQKILKVRDRLPHLKAIVQYKGALSERAPNFYDWETFMKLGEDIEDSVVEEKIKAQRPEHCALLVYTSGTTGNPKAVMLSHDNLTWTARSLHETLDEGFGTERSVGYLPLSHIAAQVADIYLPIYNGGTVNFAQPDALKGSLFKTVKEVKPTWFFGVPRVWEKLKEAIEGFVAKGAMQPTMARVAFGLGECKHCLVGAAPITVDILEYFKSIEFPVRELYGMSECSGPHSLNLEDAWKIGSVGRVMLGVQVKMDQPDQNGDGEILMYGRHVFMGYLNSEEKTLEAIDDAGWLHTGDIGRVDQDGYIYITGRIKEVIITAGGENLAPVPIEDRIKKELPFLSNVMLIGDKRKYLSCLVTLKCPVDPNTGVPEDELLPQAKAALAALGSTSSTVSEVIRTRDAVVYKAVEEGLERANRNAVSHAQRVQKFTILEKDFSLPGGELGPTLKLKRSVVVQKYAKEIDAMYEQ